MSALEQEIIERFEQLKPEEREHVLLRLQHIEKQQGDDTLEDTDNEHEVDHLARAAAFRAKLAAKYGENHTFGTQELLDELRDEASSLPWW